MNKSLIILLAIILLLGKAFSQESFIQRNCQEFIDKEEVFYVWMQEDLLQELASEKREKDVAQIMSQLSGLSILKSDTSDLDLNEELFMEVISAVQHDGYELISKVEEVETVTQYYRREGNKKRRTTEILMISNGADGCLIISALGETINIQQLKKLSL